MHMKDNIQLIGENEYRNRVTNLSKELENRGINCAFIPTGSNFLYLAGYSYNSMERLSLIILRDGGAKLFVPGLMEDQVRENSWIKDIVVWRDGENPYEVLRKEVGSSIKEKTGVEGSLPFTHLNGIFSSFRNSDVTPIDDILHNMRTRKSEAEIRLIGEAVSRSEASLLNTISELREGVTEIEIARTLEWNFVDSGLQTPSFGSIVAFGENCALPHHEPGNRKLREGDSIVIDFGGSYGGYCSDTTRTFVFGKPSAEFQKAYETVKRAQERAMLSVSTDSKYADLDTAARTELMESGYGQMTIRLGHGLGLDVHEPPFLVPSNRDSVVNRTVFTVEPGIYRLGKFGIRLEDTTHTENGKCVSFNRLNKSYNLKEM